MDSMSIGQFPDESSIIGVPQFLPTNIEQPKYFAQFVSIDTHLSKRNGSTTQVAGLANERAAGKKLAEDLAKFCNDQDQIGFETIALLPLVSGRAAEATIKAGDSNHGVKFVEENAYYRDTGVGYSVTDGVIVVTRRKY